MKRIYVNSFLLLVLAMSITGISGVAYFIHIDSPRIYLPASFLASLIIAFLFMHYDLKYTPVSNKILSRMFNIISLISLSYSWRYIQWCQYEITHFWYILILTSTTLALLATYLHEDICSKITSILTLFMINATVIYSFLFLYPTIGNDTAFHSNAIRYIIHSGHFNSPILGKYQYYPAIHIFEAVIDEILGSSIKNSHYLWGMDQYILTFTFSILLLRTIWKRKTVPISIQITLSTLLLIAPFLLQARFWYYISTYLALMFFVVLVSLTDLLPKLQTSRIKLYMLLLPLYLLLSVIHPLIFLYLLILGAILSIIYTLNKIEHNSQEQRGIIKTFAVFIALLFSTIFPKILMETWLISQSSTFVRKLAYVEPTEIVNVLSKSAPIFEYFIRDMFTVLVIILGGATLLAYSREERNVIDSFLSITGGLALLLPFGLASLFGSVLGARFLPFQELMLIPYTAIIITILLLQKSSLKIIGGILLVLFIISSLISPIYGLGRFNYENRNTLTWSEIYPLKFTKHEVNLENVYGNPLYFGLYFYFPKMARWQMEHTFNPYLDIKYYTGKYILLRTYDIKHGISFMNFKYGDVKQTVKIKESEVSFLEYSSSMIYSSRSTHLLLIG